MPASKRQPDRPKRAPDEFTLEEHLRVQREIEKRAHRIWFADGCNAQSTLADWLNAEDAVLLEFMETRMRDQTGRPASGKAPPKAGEPSFLRPEIPRRRALQTG
jgi:hypothetical protein